MTRKYRVKIKEPKDEVIDLVDMGNHNKTTVARSKLDPELHDSPIECIPEDKGQASTNLILLKTLSQNRYDTEFNLHSLMHSIFVVPVHFSRNTKAC